MWNYWTSSSRPSRNQIVQNHLINNKAGHLPGFIIYSIYLLNLFPRFFRPEEIVRCLQDLGFQFRVIGRMLPEKITHYRCGCPCPVPSETSLQPALRKKYIAGALDLFQQVQGSRKIFFRNGGPERMMQIRKGRQNPGFFSARSRLLQGGKETVPFQRIVRKRR